MIPARAQAARMARSARCARFAGTARGRGWAVASCRICSTKSPCPRIRASSTAAGGRGRVARAREGIACLAVEGCGYAGASLIGRLGVGAPSIQKAAQQGRTDRARWGALLTPEEKQRKKQRPLLRFEMLSASTKRLGLPDPPLSATRHPRYWSRSEISCGSRRAIRGECAAASHPTRRFHRADTAARPSKRDVDLSLHLP